MRQINRNSVFTTIRKKEVSATIDLKFILSINLQLNGIVILSRMIRLVENLIQKEEHTL